MSQPADTCQPGCRIQLGELLASALPVPDSLPITKPLLPAHTSLSPPPSGPAALPANAPLPPQHHKSRAVENALDQVGPPAIAPASVLAHDAAAIGSEGPCETALQGVQPSCSHRLGGRSCTGSRRSFKGSCACCLLNPASSKLSGVLQPCMILLHCVCMSIHAVTFTAQQMVYTSVRHHIPPFQLDTTLYWKRLPQI